MTKPEDMILRVIGDVHGAINTPNPRTQKSYRDLVKNRRYSLQLGDMGFNYSGLDGLNPNRHLFLPGNHDNYDALPEHALDDYGVCMFGAWSFYYVRGAWSIDINQRIARMQATGCPPIWWPQEELSREEMEKCLECYKYHKPRVVVTHSCPASISELVGSPGVWAAFGWDGPRTSNTQYLLEAMYEEHQPELWLFGHFHKNWVHITDEGTTFICIDEMGYIDYLPGWEAI